MANTYGIPDEVESRIRERDVKCVYCGKEMIQPPFSGPPKPDWATIEHIKNEGSDTDEENLAICCWECNSSKGVTPLRGWFDTEYCRDRGINAESVAEPIKAFLRRTALHSW